MKRPLVAPRCRVVLLWLLAWLLGPLPVRLGWGQAQPGPFAFGRVRQQRMPLPVQVQRNLLVVQVRLNGAGPYNFLLDTGVGTSILLVPAIADSLGLPHGEPLRVMGAGGRGVGQLAYQAGGVRVTLGRPGHEAVAPALSLVVLAGDSLGLSGYVGMPIHGILGSELFRSFVVELRTAEPAQLVLRAPGPYRPPRGPRWASLPLHVQANKAYLAVPVSLAGGAGPQVLKLVLDTGASHALSLEITSAAGLRLPTPRLPADLGRGLGGLVRGYLGRVAAVQLGPYCLPAVLTSFPNAADVHLRADVPRNGNVGFELLRRFTVVIDYPHQRLLLRPASTFREPFEHDMAGLELVAHGRNFRRYEVVRVAPGSPAALAGVEPGEELISIDFLPAGALSLTQLSRLLHSADGRMLLLVLRRPGGELHSVGFRLRRQI